MTVYYVYILETISSGGKKMYYTGYTKNLYKRWSQHRSGRGAKFCRGKDIELKYFETFRDQGDAMRRELEIKSYSRDQKKELIESIGGGV